MTELKLTFLGTSAALPTPQRNVSGLMLTRGGDSFLIDCGEGTQRQMAAFGVGMSFGRVLFTHFHADHYLGIIGLVRTLAMHGREQPLTLHGPPPAARLLREALALGVEAVPMALEIHEVEPGVVVAGDGYRIEAFTTDHRIRSFGYALIEDPRPGRFDVAAARALGVSEGPDFGRLQRGEAVALPDGRVIESALVLGPARPGRRVVLSGDTRPSPATVAAAGGADLLVHEATFADAEAARAVETGHSTAREAAEVARAAGARRLLLTHLSARYHGDVTPLLREARAVVADADIADDGQSVIIPRSDT